MSRKAWRINRGLFCLVLTLGGSVGLLRLDRMHPVPYRCARSLAAPLVIQDHEPIHGMDFSADGHWLVTAAADGKVNVWDTKAGRVVRTMTVHSGVSCLRFSCRAPVVAIGILPHSVLLLNIESGERMSEFAIRDTPSSMSFSSDGAELATAYGGDMDGADVWRVSNGEHIRELEHGACMVEFRRQPGVLVTGRRSSSIDGAVLVWDSDKWNVQRVLKGHQSPVLAAQFAPDGDTMATGGYDGAVRVWQVNSGRKVRKLAGLGYGIVAVAYAHRQHHRLVTAAGPKLVLWDLTTGKRIWCKEGNDYVTELAVSANDILAVARGNGSLEVSPLTE